MTRAAWERTITDSAGNVLTGVQIAVFQQDGITPATLYNQLSGGTTISNPFNTGVQTSAKFYADPGRYVIRAIKDGNTKEFTDVDIADKAIRDDVGTAAYLTATTSARDATEGRALRVRDFGVGFNAVQVSPAELDGISANGFYAVIGASQAPTTGPYEIQHIQFDANSAKQMAYEAGSTLTRAFIRVKAGGVWQPWRTVYNSSDVVGPVAFVGGANTGAIIERGANANGEFAKFADGTVIAWGRVISTGLTINPAGRSGNVTGYYCDPVMPTNIIDKTLTLGQRALYDGVNALIYSIEGSSSGGQPIILNLGSRPSDTWPRLDEIGTSVAVKVDYFWSAVGRWR